jgi:hypothetical protein
VVAIGGTSANENLESTPLAEDGFLYIVDQWGVLYAPRHNLSAYASASVECPDHCLGRLLQRSPGADIGAALQQAHTAFLAADMQTIVAHLRAQTTFYLPAGPGILLCKAIRGVDPRGRVAVFARANTWISDAMRRPDQLPPWPPNPREADCGCSPV